MKIARIETRHCDAGWRNYQSNRDCSEVIATASTAPVLSLRKRVC